MVIGLLTGVGVRAGLVPGTLSDLQQNLKDRSENDSKWPQLSVNLGLANPERACNVQRHDVAVRRLAPHREGVPKP